MFTEDSGSNIVLTRLTSKSMHNKLETWIDNLDEQVIQLKKSWEEGIERTTTYQLVGDNWEKIY